MISDFLAFGVEAARHGGHVRVLEILGRRDWHVQQLCRVCDDVLGRGWIIVTQVINGTWVGVCNRCGKNRKSPRAEKYATVNLTTANRLLRRHAFGRAWWMV